MMRKSNHKKTKTPNKITSEPLTISKDSFSNIEINKARSSEEALKVRYQELHTHFRIAFDLYFKGTTILFTIIGVSLGYVLQARLSPIYSRFVCFYSLTTLILWYISNIWTLRFYKSITGSISEASDALGVKYDEGNYKIFKLIILLAFGTFTPVTLVMIYFLIYPPKP